MSNNEIKYRKKIQTTHLKDESETKALRMRKGNSAQCRLTQECQIIHLNSKCKPNHFYINSMQVNLVDTIQQNPDFHKYYIHIT